MKGNEFWSAKENTANWTVFLSANAQKKLV